MHYVYNLSFTLMGMLYFGFSTYAYLFFSLSFFFPFLPLIYRLENTKSWFDSKQNWTLVFVWVIIMIASLLVTITSYWFCYHLYGASSIVAILISSMKDVHMCWSLQHQTSNLAILTFNMPSQKLFGTVPRYMYLSSYCVD